MISTGVASPTEGLSFEQFATVFGEMITDTGESVVLPKLVRDQLETFHAEVTEDYARALLICMSRDFKSSE